MEEDTNGSLAYFCEDKRKEDSRTMAAKKRCSEYHQAEVGGLQREGEGGRVCMCICMYMCVLFSLFSLKEMNALCPMAPPQFFFHFLHVLHVHAVIFFLEEKSVEQFFFPIQCVGTS